MIIIYYHVAYIIQVKCIVYCINDIIANCIFAYNVQCPYVRYGTFYVFKRVPGVSRVLCKSIQ